MKKLLIIEDNKAILRGLTDNFTKEHFEVVSSTDGAKGYKMASTSPCDLIILDVMLPGMNGYDVCKKLRADGIQIPILMLTGKGEEMDKVLGLELGADDYVAKPFGIRELVARVKALLRRQSVVVTELAEITIGDVHVDFVKQEAVKGSKPVKMSSREFQLLKYLAEREGKVVTRNQLLDDVWGYDVTPTTRTVDNYILSLRKKIEARPKDPKHLLTVHTSGYKLVI